MTPPNDFKVGTWRCKFHNMCVWMHVWVHVHVCLSVSKASTGHSFSVTLMIITISQSHRWVKEETYCFLTFYVKVRGVE